MTVSGRKPPASRKWQTGSELLMSMIVTYGRGATWDRAGDCPGGSGVVGGGGGG